jgi:hypothetical protein
MNSSDGHQALQVLLYKVGHVAIQRKSHDFPTVHAVHVEELFSESTARPSGKRSFAGTVNATLALCTRG